MEEEVILENERESEKWIQHYSSHQKILLVGEGNFSFAACLARAFGSAANMVATSLDSKEQLLSKYSRAASNLNEVEERGCRVLHQVNAHTMSQHPLLYSKTFDRIVFNFPHAGFLDFFKDHDSVVIRRHQGLVRGFLRSARMMLKKRGEVHVTHKTAYPFDRWEIEELAKEMGLRLLERSSFHVWDYIQVLKIRGEMGGDAMRVFLLVCVKHSNLASVSLRNE